MTEPYGEILKFKPMHCTKSVQEWNPKTKQYEWAAEMIDKNTYFSDGPEMHHLNKGQCRICEKQITPYSQKYFQKHYENGYKYCIQYDCDNFYCEDCAKTESDKNFFNDCLPREVDRFTSMRDEQLVETVIYEDGSRLEEMTSREMARAMTAF